MHTMHTASSPHLPPPISSLFTVTFRNNLPHKQPMRPRRPRRRGDWARRLTSNMDPLSSDSDVFPCDSSSSSDSFSSYDNVPPRRPHYSLPELPPLDIRDLSFAEYAAAELPDLAIFFRSIFPPLSSPSPLYSHRIPSYNTSLSDCSLAVSSSPRSPRPPRNIPKSARLPPAFPDSSRRPHSARHPQHTHSQFRDTQHELPSPPPRTNSPPSSPPTLHRSRSAPIRPSHFSSHSPTSTTPRPRNDSSSSRQKSSQQDSNPSQNNRPRRRSSLRRSSSLRHQSSSSRRNSVLLPSGQLPNSAPRLTPKHNPLSSSNILTTRRYPEDLELAAQNALVPPAIANLDPDSLNHFFLVDKIYRWYTRFFLDTGEHHITLYMR